MGRTYRSSDSQKVRINSHLWGFVQKFAEEFYQGEDKGETPECEYTATAEEIAAACCAIDAIAEGATFEEVRDALSVFKGVSAVAAANKAHLTAVIAAIKDPDCAELKAELCELLSDDISFSGSGV